jgi:hypothetical protein
MQVEAGTKRLQKLLVLGLVVSVVKLKVSPQGLKPIFLGSGPALDDTSASSKSVG